MTCRRGPGVSDSLSVKKQLESLSASGDHEIRGLKMEVKADHNFFSVLGIWVAGDERPWEFITETID